MKNVNSEEKTNKRISVTFNKIDSKWKKQGLSSQNKCFSDTSYVDCIEMSIQANCNFIG